MVTAWLALSLCFALMALLAVRAQGSHIDFPIVLLALPSVTLVAWLCLGVPLGKPIEGYPPPGQYTVIGARIDVDKAIYVLLDSGDGPPVYRRVPYTTGTANDLQEALDTAANGGTVKATMNGEGGGMSYDGEPPVTDDSNKQAERPELQVGG